MSDNDYNSAGFDNFLSRSIDNTPQLNLDTPTAPNNAVAFDRTQVTGALGDTYTIGNIHLNGSKNDISTIDSNSNKRISLGTQSNGSEALIISREGTDADINRPKDLIFNSTLSLFQAAIVDTYTFPSGTLTAGATLLQDFKLNIAKVGSIPGFNAFARLYKTSGAQYANFPPTYYTQLVDHLTSGELGSSSIGSSWGIGIDDTYFYISRSIFNAGGTDFPYSATPVKYYIFQQTIT